ncbi:hypothetical protein KUV22_17070 [Microbulbifer agarilyticus]|uniref:hypothetical protein n=1 Tax=Microbulbifer agarilyticus TaxID=260552 RepID=UPI001C98A36C|nr:hypothetical protein [Microbulbifer agarilyticus]MBY6192136.1 hypothetical protein [Microbulbifer agarilyticus]
MNIDKLAKIKNLNTREQNEISKFNIAKIAKLFHDTEIFPDAIRCWLKSNNFSKDNSILVEFGQGPICCDSTFSGTLLNEELEFWEFEIELDAKSGNIVEIYDWKNITKEISVTEHAKGVGKSWGFLCVQVLREHLQSG